MRRNCSLALIVSTTLLLSSCFELLRQDPLLYDPHKTSKAIAYGRFHLQLNSGDYPVPEQGFRELIAIRLQREGSPKPIFIGYHLDIRNPYPVEFVPGKYTFEGLMIIRTNRPKKITKIDYVGTEIIMESGKAVYFPDLQAIITPSGSQSHMLHQLNWRKESSLTSFEESTTNIIKLMPSFNGFRFEDFRINSRQAKSE